MVNLGCMVMTCTVHHQCLDQMMVHVITIQPRFTIFGPYIDDGRCMSLPYNLDSPYLVHTLMMDGACDESRLYGNDMHHPSSMYGPNMVNLGCMVMTCTVHHQCMDQIWRI
jgi:hypothetical protein